MTQQTIESVPASATPACDPLRTFWLLVTLTPVLIVAVPLLRLLQALSHWYSFETIRNAYTFLTIQLPLLLAVIGLYGLYARRRGNPRASRRVLLTSAAFFAGAFALVGTRVYATHIEPYRLHVREVEFVSDKVTQPLRILHISDIQSGGIGPYEEEAFALMRSLEPDIVFHTGDLIQPIRPKTIDSEWPKLAALMETLDPPLGVYNVVGDVCWQVIPQLERREGGWKTLVNEGRSIEWKGGRIAVFGLDLPETRSHYGSAELITSWLEEAGDEELTILFGHAPDYIFAAREHPIDLCLAGHTHGGQIRVPLLGPILTLSSVPRDWARGFHEIGLTRLNVSAGVGSEHSADLPAIRVLCPPEMTLITVRPEVSDP